jgi:phage-related protein
MATAEELIVAIRSEGVGETQQDLEGVERSMEETAESAGESAEELEGFSERFAGAMGAAVAALAVGAAGLLSQVPVLGEAFAGLGAIVDAVALKMDDTLRPVIGPITNQLFEWANAINEAEGPLGTLIGIIGTVASVLAVALGGAIAFGAAFSAASAAIGTAIGVITTVGSVIAGLITTIVSLPVVLAAVIAALIAFAVAYLTNWKGTRDKTNAIIGEIIDFVVGGFKTLASKALTAVSNFAADVREWFAGLASDLSAWASDLAGDAREWGASLIERFIAGIRSAIGRLQNFLSDLRNIGANVGIDVPDLGGVGGGGGGGTGAGGGPGGGPRFRGAGTGGQQIDGRQLTESTGRYRSGPSRRQGL